MSLIAYTRLHLARPRHRHQARSMIAPGAGAQTTSIAPPLALAAVVLLTLLSAVGSALASAL